MAGSPWQQATLSDRGVLCSGAAVLVTSFLPYIGVALGGFSESTTAWTSFAVLGLLLMLAVSVVAGLRMFANLRLPSVPGGWSLYLTIASALGVLLVILRALTAGGAFGALVSVQWGGYLLFIAGIAQAVFAGIALRAAASSAPGTSMPSESE